MPMLQVAVIVDGDPSPVETLLASLGADSLTFEDAGDDLVLEPAPGEMPLWPALRIRALFAPQADRREIEHALSTLLSPPRDLEFAVLEDRDWEREWLRDFRPMRFGRRLWVCPGGQPAGEEDAVCVALDPGLAFGTGAHPTTALCLEWLADRELAGRRVIDYGCGSGILAIAALKLGASEAIAFDIDPQALLATRENAQRNGVAHRLQIVGVAPEGPAGCDILVANILAGPLRELAGRFAALLRPGGEIALSGLLTDQVASVVSAYRPWSMIGATAVRDGWALLSGRRHTKNIS